MTSILATSYSTAIRTALAAMRAGDTAALAFSANAVNVSNALDSGTSLRAIVAEYKIVLKGVTDAADLKALKDAGLTYTSPSSIGTHGLLGAYLRTEEGTPVADPRAEQEILRKITIDLPDADARKICAESGDRAAALKALKAAGKAATASKKKKEEEAAARKQATADRLLKAQGLPTSADHAAAEAAAETTEAADTVAPIVPVPDAVAVADAAGDLLRTIRKAAEMVLNGAPVTEEVAGLLETMLACRVAVAA